MATTRRLTLEQFLALPDTKPASEFMHGEVIQKPMPDTPHSLLQGYLLRIIFQFLVRTALGIVGPELRCVLGPPGGEQGYVPDVVFISYERVRAGMPARSARCEPHPTWQSRSSRRTMIAAGCSERRSPSISSTACALCG